MKRGRTPSCDEDASCDRIKVARFDPASETPRMSWGDVAPERVADLLRRVANREVDVSVLGDELAAATSGAGFRYQARVLAWLHSLPVLVLRRLCTSLTGTAPPDHTRSAVLSALEAAYAAGRSDATQHALWAQHAHRLALFLPRFAVPSIERVVSSCVRVGSIASLRLDAFVHVVFRCTTVTKLPCLAAPVDPDDSFVSEWSVVLRPAALVCHPGLPAALDPVARCAQTLQKRFRQTDTLLGWEWHLKLYVRPGGFFGARCAPRQLWPMYPDSGGGGGDDGDSDEEKDDSAPQFNLDAFFAAGVCALLLSITPIGVCCAKLVREFVSPRFCVPAVARVPSRLVASEGVASLLGSLPRICGDAAVSGAEIVDRSREYLTARESMRRCSPGPAESAPLDFGPDAWYAAPWTAADVDEACLTDFRNHSLPLAGEITEAETRVDLLALALS